jgi:hypothetical protein
MTTTTDVMMSILALDAYNRGYAPGIAGLSDAKDSRIGSATIDRTAEDAEGAAKAAGFFAVQYSLGGTTVISYRGTTFTGLPDRADVLNGWSL